MIAGNSRGEAFGRLGEVLDVRLVDLAGVDHRVRELVDTDLRPLVLHLLEDTDLAEDPPSADERDGEQEQFEDQHRCRATGQVVLPKPREMNSASGFQVG